MPLVAPQRGLLYTLSALSASVSLFFVFYSARLLTVTHGLSATRAGGEGAYIGALIFPALAIACGWASWRCAVRARRATIIVPLH